MNLIDKINELREKYNLSEDCIKEIIKISEESYISGSNAAHEALCKKINKG